MSKLRIQSRQSYQDRLPKDPMQQHLGLEATG